jgi:tRNA (guanine-N(7)-)-methyltransferase
VSTAPDAAAREAERRDVVGALGGSRLFEQPRWAHEAAAWRAFVAAGPPVLVEIGFDHGRRLTHTAKHHPGWRVAGLEIRRRRVDEAVAWAAANGLDNLLAWRADARTVLATLTPPASLTVVEALFPDPWWIPAHRDRRLLVSARFLDDVAAALVPGGVLHLATDVADYADHIAALLDGAPVAGGGSRGRVDAVRPARRARGGSGGANATGSRCIDSGRKS